MKAKAMMDLPPALDRHGSAVPRFCGHCGRRLVVKSWAIRSFDRKTGQRGPIDWRLLCPGDAWWRFSVMPHDEFLLTADGVLLEKWP